MAEQWDPSNGESRGPGGPGLNRNALQATLADLVREADGPASGAGGSAASGAGGSAAPAPGAQAAGSPRPLVPGAPVPTPSAGPRPLRGPSASRPVVDADLDEFDGPDERVAPPRPAGGVGRISGLAAAAAAAEDSQAGPASADGASRPAPAPRAAPAPRPKLPFAPEPAPAGAGPAGVVRPGSGIGGGFSSSIAGASLGGGSGMGGSGMGGSGMGGSSMGGSSIGGSSMGGGSLGGGALTGNSLGGRITPGDLGDNLARLTPAPTEQPTIPLRKRRPAAESAAESDGVANGSAGEAGKAAQGPPDQAPAQPARPAVVLEAWSPQYDDILPQRPTRTGRAFRRAR